MNYSDLKMRAKLNMPGEGLRASSVVSRMSGTVELVFPLHSANAKEHQPEKT